MRITSRSPLSGIVLAGIGAAALVTLPSQAASGPPKLYFHSAAGSYEDDALADPSASIGGRAPNGATLDDKVPTKAESAQATSSDVFGTPGSVISPTWEMPDTGTISSACLDIWAESASGAEVGELVAHLYIQTQNTVVANLPTEDTFASFSELAVANYTGGVVRMTGVIKTTVPYQLAPETTINFTISPLAGQADFTLHYDSVKNPSSITLNPTSCTAGALPTAPPSGSEEPSEEPSAEPTEEPSIDPSIDPSASASVCPSGEPSPGGSEEPSEEPSEDPDPSGSPADTNSAEPNPVLDLVEELTGGGQTSSPPASGSARAAADTEQVDAAPAAADCPSASRETEISYTGARSGRYGDVVTFAATVTDAAGVPAAGGTVTFLVGNTRYTAPVGSGGRATITARVNQAPETYLLETRYSGATGFAPSTVQDGFVVSKAVAVCSLQRGVSSTASTLIAVLSRPDGARVGNATMTFLHNNRSVGTARTDSRGIARREAPRGRAGDVFSVTFAGDAFHSACRKDLRA